MHQPQQRRGGVVTQLTEGEMAQIRVPDDHARLRERIACMFSPSTFRRSLSLISAP
jgi:hypothetical protein